jgi:hypothetical protein
MFVPDGNPHKGRRRGLRSLFGAAALAILAACQPSGMGGGPSINANAPVPVALLVPRGSGRENDEALAVSLENAARLAISDLDGVRIDLRVYATAADPGAAAAAAQQAVSAGAKIILGPVYSGAANAAGTAVASRGINVLAFSNNTEIAGGNVFVMGNLFTDIADRLARFAQAQGKNSFYIVSADTPGEAVARRAVATALAATGALTVGTTVFEASQQSVIEAIPEISQNARSSNAEAVFFTSTNDGALPFLAQLLPENGLRPSETQFIGLGRLDIPATALSQPGLQGAWFALPDPSLNDNFQSRYTARYGSAPHPIAGLAYDGIAAIGALVSRGDSQALTAQALTQPSGFVGVNGIFRLRPDGTNQRGLAVAQIQNSKVVVIDRAPRSFSAGSGF